MSHFYNYIKNRFTSTKLLGIIPSIGKLTKKIINGFSFTGESNISDYVICTDDKNEVNKKISVPFFNLTLGASINVKFLNGNLASNITLNVSNTGAKELKIGTTNVPKDYILENQVYTIIYDGSAYQLLAPYGNKGDNVAYVVYNNLLYPVTQFATPKTVVEKVISKITIQDTSYTLTSAELIPEGYSTYKFSGTRGEVINGRLEYPSDYSYLTFIPDGKGGSTGQYTYVCKDTKSQNELWVTVLVEIQYLPPIEAFVYDTTAEVDVHKVEYTPPTLADVFNKWSRFSNNTSYYPAGTTPGGEATKWEMISENQFRCTINSSYLTGFISPKSYTSYVHEVTLSSTNGDDDYICVVLAYKHDGGNNKVLVARRQYGGANTNNNFALVYYNGGANTILKNVSVKTGGSGTSDPGNWSSNTGWAKAGPTRVYTSRVGNIFTIKCSDWKDKTLQPYNENTTLQYDISTNSNLSWALDACPYGYACHSQNYSSFTDVVFEGGEDTKNVYSIQDGKLYTYQDGSWVISTKTPQSLWGWPRTVTNPNTGISYRITETSVEKIS